MVPTHWFGFYALPSFGGPLWFRSQTSPEWPRYARGPLSRSPAAPDPLLRRSPLISVWVLPWFQARVPIPASGRALLRTGSRRPALPRLPPLRPLPLWRPHPRLWLPPVPPCDSPPVLRFRNRFRATESAMHRCQCGGQVSVSGTPPLQTVIHAYPWCEAFEAAIKGLQADPRTELHSAVLLPETGQTIVVADGDVPSDVDHAPASPPNPS
jgi:hypothetical protein